MELASDRSQERKRPESFYRIRFYYFEPRLASYIKDRSKLYMLDSFAFMAGCFGDRRTFQYRETDRDVVVFEFNIRNTEHTTSQECLVRTTSCIFDWLDFSNFKDVIAGRVEIANIVNNQQDGEPEDQTIEARSIEMALRSARDFDPYDPA